MSNHVFKIVIVTIFMLLVLSIATCLAILAVDFRAFKADFHTVYFPNYGYNQGIYPQGEMGNSMMGYGMPQQDSKIDQEFLDMAHGQWASGAIASSTYNAGYGSDAWDVKNATGKPNTYFYGDNGTAWAPQNITGSTETLTLTFDKAVYATGVNIKESYGSGAIVKVEIGQGKTLHVVWEGKDETRGLNYLKVAFDKTDYLVDTVKITLDGARKSPNEWMEIDAVQLVGE